MNRQIIISIGREFGSGGHAIAEIVAKDLGINMYDRNMLDEIAREKGIDVDSLHRFDEKPRNPFLSRSVRGYSSSMEENLAQLQFEFIKNKADSGESFVIVGRCAEHVLKDRDSVISIFVLGDKQEKIARVKAKYDLDREEALTKMTRHDKKRKAYHNSYTDSKWGDSRGYDLCVNSSRLGVEGTAKFIESYIEFRKNNMDV